MTMIEMTLERARKLGLDIMTVTPGQETPLTAGLRAQQREVIAFDHIVHTAGGNITLRMLAVGPRPVSGIAAAMKARNARINEAAFAGRKKTVMEIIQEERQNDELSDGL